jgi:Tol biopolymer transport system component
VFANGQDIFLVDKELNKVVNLSTNSYKFITRSGEYKNRFLIIYTSNYGGGGIDISAGIQFAKRDSGVQINSESDKISEVIVYDLNGKPIYKNSNINSNEHTINFSRYSSNIVIVTVRTERGEIFTRKFTNNR